MDKTSTSFLPKVFSQVSGLCSGSDLSGNSYDALEEKKTLSAVIQNLKLIGGNESYKANIETEKKQASLSSIQKSSSILAASYEISKINLNDSIASPADNDKKRLALIKELDIESAPQEPYDNLTSLASRLTSCPMSCISLVKEHQTFYKSHTGGDVSEIPNEISFCVHAIHHPEEIFEVGDLKLDDRFKDHPLVKADPHLRFYAGVSLVTVDGSALGTLCVLDYVPRNLNAAEKEYLTTLATQARAEIDLRITLSRLQTQMALTEKLLQNILPAGIIERLKNRNDLYEMGVIADSFECATIMFIDIVNFTGFAGSVSAAELVHLLGSLFTSFDDAIRIYGVTKIKTIGDGYMVVGGVPDPFPTHAQKIVECGCELLKRVQKHNECHGTNFQIRIGVNSGNLMAGVVGIDKFTYDCFGDAVNIASRLESTGKPGKIHISESTYDLIKSDFECEKLENLVDLKGKGKLPTFFVSKKIE